MAEDIQEFTFNVSDPARLKLGNIRGSVEVSPGEESVIYVKAVKHPDTGDAKRTEIIAVQEEDGGVKVETRYPEGGWFFAGKPCKVDYIVHVPRHCSADLSGVSCSISVIGLEGDLRISSVSGQVEMGAINGSLSLNTVSGGIHGSRLSGPLSLESVSGSVRLEESSIAELKANTVSGNLWVDTDLGVGPYKIKSVSGNASLVIPAESACSVKMESLSGRLRTSLPAQRQQTERTPGVGGKFNAELNGGGTTVYFNSVSGHLALEPRGGAVAAPAQEDVKDSTQGANVSSQASSKDSTIDILKQVENGEISVEEALKRMS
jgi:hypothetical protein